MKDKEIFELNKSAWMLVEHAKNITTQNVTNLVLSGKLKIDKEILPILLSVLGSSIEQGGHQAMVQFSKTVESFKPKENKKK